MALDLLITLFLVVMNGTFVATEFSITRLRPTQVDEALREGRAGAKSAQHAVQHIDAYLAACQLGITIASLGLGAIGEEAFHGVFESVLGDSARVVGIGIASLLGFLVITIMHVVLGELTPKSFAIASTVPLALKLTPLIRVFYTATKPIVDLLNGLGNLLLKPFGVPTASEAGSQPHSEDEIRDLLRESGEAHVLGREEQRFSENALVFGDRRAREVMTPRPEVDSVGIASDVRGAAEVAMRTGRTRLPLVEHEGDLDTATQVINAKDLLRAAVVDDDRSLVELARPIHRVADSVRVDEVLRNMRRSRHHVALVEDEHQTVVGLLTLEDILEEIVGEIEDEYDEEAVEDIRREGEAWLVQGSAGAREVAARIGVQVEVPPHEATVSGQVVEQLGRVPKVGEHLTLGGHDVEVLDADETHVSRLRIAAERLDGEDPVI